jgi:hypothetical protein
MATNPLILDAEALKRLQPPTLQQLPPMQAQAPQPIAMPSGPNPLTMLPTPAMPTVSRIPNEAEQNSSASLLGHQQELKRLTDTGSGVSQIKNPFLRTLGRIGDVAESAILPGVARITPGTTMNHDRLVGQQQGYVNNDLENQHSEAATTLLDAQPELKQASLDNQTLKTQGVIQHQQDQAQHYQDQIENVLRGQGYKHDANGHVVPLAYQEMSSQQQAVEDYKQAQTEQAEATAAMKKAQNDPSSPAYKLAKQRADAASQNANTAIARLSRQDRGLDMRRELMDANLYGTGKDGQALTGTGQLLGDDGETHSVGIRLANNAEKQQSKVGTFNDLIGSARHANNELENLYASGSDFSDPKVVAAMSDPHSMVGKVINGQLIKANLSDQQVRAIGAVNQLREQIGILRATASPGSAAEAQAQRMLDTLPSAGTPKNMSKNQMEELTRTLERVSPAITHVAGGLSVKAATQPAGGTPQTFRQTATGPNGHKIGSNDGTTWVDIQTGKAIQ